jgi:hypothetical protein
MALLIVGLVLFIGIHVVPSLGGLRSALVTALGEGGYKILFALVAAAGLVLTGIGYGQAPQEQIFVPSLTARISCPPPWRWRSCWSRWPTYRAACVVCCATRCWPAS